MQDPTAPAVTETAKTSFHEGERLFASAPQQEQAKKQAVYQQAGMKFEEVLSAGYKPAESLFYLGLIAMNTGNNALAMERLKASVATDPNRVQARYYLGELYRMDDQEDNARAQYEAVRDLDPAHAEAKARLAEIAAKHRTPQTYLGDTYDMLRSAGDEFSKAAVRLIDETRIVDRKVILSAYNPERYFFLIPSILLLLIGAYVFGFGGLRYKNTQKTYEYYFSVAYPGGGLKPGPTPTKQQISDLQVVTKMRNAAQNQFWLGVFLLVIGGVIYLLPYRVYRAIIYSKLVTIDRGVITVESGLFTRRKVIYEIYRITDFEASQNFFNRTSGDGSLDLTFDDKKNKSIRGLAKYAELKDLALKLRSLHLMLRSTNINKGVMGM